MAGFLGFPPGAIDFLRELEANNDRDWFKANRGRYDELLVAAAPLVRWLRERVGPSERPRARR